MEWDEIMRMDDPHKALIAIYQKVDEESLPVQEMEDRTEQYAKVHGISTFEMAYYPNGDNVLATL